MAGILLKRLKKGWKLQVDASVQYAMANVKCTNLLDDRQALNVKCDNWWPMLKTEDLKIDSPYNTYTNLGLPPGPICNPGLASIKAVVNPKETDYWYYLSDKQGNIRYAKTNEEHEENIAKYLKPE